MMSNPPSRSASRRPTKRRGANHDCTVRLGSVLTSQREADRIRRLLKRHNVTLGGILRHHLKYTNDKWMREYKESMEGNDEQ